MSEQEQSSAEDKSHEPTAQKLRKSREKGDVPYSSEATAAATYIAFYLMLLVFAGWAVGRIFEILAIFLRRPDDAASHIFAVSSSGFTASVAMELIPAAAPIFMFLAAAALVSIFGQQAMVFAPSKIKPKLSRISIIDNAKQKYGLNGFVEFLKSTAKLSAVLAILLFATKDRFFELPALTGSSAFSVMELLHREAVFFTGLIAGAAVLIAAIDFPWRIFQHRKRLRMTYEELKKENKETEGDPALKGARRQRAEALATNRMMNDVPKSDIVLVNPTHFAVALQWDRERGGAPVCVAKGVDEVAARIREAASEAGVPIKRDPPTARSIYSLVDIGKEIRREHYAAVAAAIHYAEEMRRKWRKAYSS